jgi:hypothetical protein
VNENQLLHNLECKITSMGAHSTAAVPPCLLDSGTFNHMFGTAVMPLVTNIREMEAYPVKTAGGIVYLREKGDLHIGPVHIIGGFVNPHMDTTLIAEGKMVVEGGWAIQADGKTGRVVRTPHGDFQAQRHEFLYYLPDDIIQQELNSRHETAPAGGLLSMCNEGACAQQRREPDDDDGTPGPGEEPESVAAAGTKTADGGGGGETTEVEQVENDQRGQEQILADQTGHRQCSIKDCQTCLKSHMRAKYATKDSQRITALETVNADIIDFSEEDNNGNRYTLDAVVLGSAFGAVANSSNKRAATILHKWNRIKYRLKALTDPGGKLGYEIQRLHTDPGSEFEGAMRDGLGQDSVVCTKGEVNRHTSSAVVEGRNRTLQQTGAALAAVAIGDNDGIKEALHGELILWSNTLINHSRITKFQHSNGVSAYQEQSGTNDSIQDVYGKLYTWGSLCYAYVPKEKRSNKLSQRAVACIWAGYDDDTPGAHRVVPFSSDGEEWSFFPTQLCMRVKIFEGTFPLRSKDASKACGRHVQFLKADEQCWDSCDVDEAPKDQFQVEAVVSHSQSPDGSYEYELKWIGWETDTNTWHHEEDLPDCQEFIAEYWAKQDQDVPRPEAVKRVKAPAGSEAAATEPAEFDITAVAEIPIDKALSGSKRTEVLAAIDKELESIYKLRARDAIDLTTKQKLQAMECRLAITQKRATAEQIAEGRAIDDGKFKARLVCKDLKVIHKLPIEQTYSGVPGLNGFRLLISAYGSSAKYSRISTTDFDTAFLQSDDYPDGERLRKYKNPRTGQWQYIWIRGPTYGEQDAAALWGKTRSRVLTQEMGFKQAVNIESVYIHESRPIITSCHVDDPLTIAGSLEDETWFYNELRKHFLIKEITVLEPGTDIDYLSMRLTLDTNGVLRVDNFEKIKQFLKEKNMQDCNSCHVPLTKEALARAANEKNRLLEPEEVTEWLSDIGKMSWLAQTTHPTLTTAVSIASSFNKAPTEGCLDIAKSFYRYLQHAKDLALVRDPGNAAGMEMYSDADWAGLFSITGDPRSRTGTVIYNGGMPVMWGSQWQKCKGTQCNADGLPVHQGQDSTEVEDIDLIATASAESELYALSDSLKAGIQINNMAQELGISSSDKVHIYVDATAAIGFANGTSGQTRMKHLDLRQAWIQQVRDRSTAEFIKVDGTANKADFFTKLLSRVMFKEAEADLMAKLPAIQGSLDK